MCAPAIAAAAVTAASTLYTARKQRKAQERAEQDAESARVEAQRLFDERETENDTKRKAEEATRRSEENRRSAQLIVGGPRQSPQRGFGLRLFDGPSAAGTGNRVPPPTLGV